jgi:hypothetical protein
MRLVVEAMARSERAKDRRSLSVIKRQKASSMNLDNGIRAALNKT